MTHAPTCPDHAGAPGMVSLIFPTEAVTGMVARYRAARAARKAIRDLSQHSSAALSDIGLMHADLWAEGYEPAAAEKATDAQARAMLRVYQ